MKVKVNVYSEGVVRSSIVEGVKKIIPYCRSDEEVHRRGIDKVDIFGMYVDLVSENGESSTYRASITDFELIN